MHVHLKLKNLKTFKQIKPVVAGKLLTDSTQH